MDHFQFKPQISPEFVVRSLHLKVPVLPEPDYPYTGVVTDSRKIIPGCLFVALKGEKVDGHDFIEKAIQSGARAILCRRGTSLAGFKGVTIFWVEDTLAAYRRLAAAWRREFSYPVISVAGSAGKTTTKELLSAILKGRWTQVVKTEGSQNGFIGIPMTLLELKPETEAAVVEVGIDEIGAMQEHLALVRPTASVLTSVGPEHLEKLRDIPTVAQEEGLALSYVARNDGIVAINLDDPWIKPHLFTLRGGRKIPFSMEGNTAPMDMIQGILTGDGKTLTFSGLGLPETTLELPILGKHNARNLLGAIAVAAGLGLNSEEIVAGLKNFQGAVGRSQIIQLPGPSWVICDYYNAQPASVKAGLELLSELSQNRGLSKIRWACLGDMLELGQQEEMFHREIANVLVPLGIENVLLYGPRMVALRQELADRKYPGKVQHFTHQSDLGHTLCQTAKAGDSILIKGSRGMKMEEVWKVFEPYAKSHWENSHESQTSPSHP